MARLYFHPEGRGRERCRDGHTGLDDSGCRWQPPARCTEPAAGFRHLRPQRLRLRAGGPGLGAPELGGAERPTYDMRAGGHSSIRWDVLRVPGWLLRLEWLVPAVQRGLVQGERRRRCGVLALPGRLHYAGHRVHQQRGLREACKLRGGRGFREFRVREGLLRVRLVWLRSLWAQ